ncbi:hypothetical protein [Runella sp.]|uniref:hypothetical protein n=1 Tax=Runella sp. TaxID=1960881 RepID=UPI00261780AE|nr:hypothetical protein [Runella sp.]
MGELAHNETFAEHGMVSHTFGYLQREEIESTIQAFEQQHPDAIVALAMHSAGNNAGDNALNHLYEQHGIEADNITHLSTPPDALSSELVAPVDHHENLFTTGTDFGIADDINHFPGAINTGYDLSHSAIDNAPEVHEHIINSVMDTLHTATCSPHEHASDFYHQDDYQQATFEATPHLNESHQDFSTFDHESHHSDFGGHDIGYGF